MNLAELFRTYLLEKEKLSRISAKNYVADLNRFLNWFESNFQKPFEPTLLTPDVISLFKNTQGGKITDASFVSSSAARSFERYMSTLRRFAKFLIAENHIFTNPFDELNAAQPKNQSHEDPWKIKLFRDYLYMRHASRATIKNYAVDITAFTTWLATALADKNEIANLGSITPDIIEEYKDRLTNTLSLSHISVNRKLSSIRKYLEFGVNQGLINPHEARILNIKPEAKKANLPVKLGLADFHEEAQDKEHIKEKKSYSKFPPLRLAQKLFVPYLALEGLVAGKIASTIKKGRLAGKAADLSSIGKTISNGTIPSHKSVLFKNYPKEFYAPHKISLKNLAWHRKVVHHAKYTRPKWYKQYHNLPIVHYFHFAVLIIYASALGFILYTNLFAAENQESAFAAPSSPPRILNFQGRLTNATDTPITTATNVRFSIYDDLIASGSGNLLWQEVIQVSPDQDGIFSELLGNNTPCAGQPLTPQTGRCAFPDDLFTDNDTLYLGITIENTAELAPRQRLAAVAYAANSEALQGMRPITDTAVNDNTNAILALDSSGNVTLGGATAPTIQATNSQFTLSGTTLLLTTEPSSDGDVVIAPDGLGGIDVQKPLFNSTNNGNLVPGGVEINDKFGVLATESAVAAFIVNNNTTGGDIFAASSSGTTRFVIANDGDLGLQAGASVDTLTTGSISIGGTNATTISIGRSGQGITLPGFTTNGGIFYANGAGQLGQTSIGSSGQCLQSSGGGAPSWGACGSGSNWTIGNGIMYPNNNTVDILIGGTSSSSAKFAIRNINSGTPTASISANSGANATFLSGTGNLGTTNMQNLTLGGTTTGNIRVMNRAGSVFTTFDTVNSRVGIGTNVPTSIIDIAGSGASTDFRLTRSGNPSAYLSISSVAGGNTQSTLGISGTNVMSLGLNGGVAIGSYSGGGTATPTNGLIVSGNVGIGTSGPDRRLDVLDASNPQLRLTHTDGSVYTDFQTNSSGDLVITPSGGDTNITGTLDVSGHGAFGANASISTTNVLNIVENSTDDVGSRIGVASTITYTGTATHSGGTGYSGIRGSGYINSNGTINNLSGISAQIGLAASSTTGHIQNARTFWAVQPGFTGTGTITNQYGLAVSNQGNASITNAYGISIASPTNATGNNSALMISGVPSGGTGNYALWLNNTSGTAAGGITFGTDTNLYRSAANTLRTDDAFNVNGNLNITSAGAISAATGITSSGNITFSTFSTNGGLLYTNGSGLLAQTGAGTSGECLQSAGGGSPIWGDCDAGATTNWWTVTNGALHPINNALDMLIGGTATDSAKFGFLNVDSGTPVASISANTGANATYLTGDGTLATTNRADLTLGNSSTYNTTGNILLNPNGTGRVAVGTTSPLSLFTVGEYSDTVTSLTIGNDAAAANYGLSAFNNNLKFIAPTGFRWMTGTATGTEAMTLTGGNLGINNTTPLATLDVRGTSASTPVASISGQTSSPALVVDNAAGSGPQFVAYKSGENVFEVDNDGNLIVGPGGSGKITAAIIDPYLVQNQYTTGNTQLTFQTMATSNGDFVFQNQSTDLATLFQEGLLHLEINGSSAGLQIGDDTQLFRGATNRLDLSSGDSFNLVSGNLQIGGTTVVDSSRNATFENITINGTCSGCTPSPNDISKWAVGNGALYPRNSTLDVLFGGTASTSAKFAIRNMNSGTPVASISANSGNYATYLTGDGTLARTNRGDLTLGNSSTYNTTRNILLNPNGTGNIGIANTAPDSRLTVGADPGALTNGTVATFFSGDDTTVQIASNANNNGAGPRLRLFESNVNMYGTELFYDTGANSFSIVNYSNDSETARIHMVSGNVGIGTSGPDAKLDSLSTSTQLRLTYTDGSAYTNFTTNSGGDLVIAPSGGDIAITGTLDVNGHGAFGTSGNVTSDRVLDIETITTTDAANFFSIVNSSRANATITNVYGIHNRVDVESSGVVTNMYGIHSLNPNNNGTITNNYGIHIADQTSGANDYGLAIAGADTQALWISSGGNNTDAANGIAFGLSRDTNLYRSAANTLRTDDAFNVNGNFNITSAGAISAATGITSSGNITFSSLTTNGGLLYTNGSGLLAQTGAGTSGQCLISNGGGAPTFGSCATGVTTSPFWSQTAGVLHPNNLTLDFTLGGNASNSAKFAIRNMNSGTPVASISANTGAYATYLTGDGTLARTNRGDLTLGNSSTYNTTRNILLNPNGTGNVGIGTTAPATNLHIYGSTANLARIERSDSNNAPLEFKNSTASVYVGLSDLENFTIGTGQALTATAQLTVLRTSGNVGIGTTGPDRKLDVLDASNPQLRLTHTDGSVYSDFQTNSSGDLTIAPSGGDTSITGNLAVSGTGGLSLSGNGAGITFSGTGNHDITASSGTLRLGAVTLTGAVTGNGQNITGLGNLSASGSITFSGFSTNGGLLYTNGSGLLAQTGAGTSGQCLISNGGGAPIWGACDSGAAGSWTINNTDGTLYPINNSLDVLIGGTSTSSAKFAFTNVDSGNPTLTIYGPGNTEYISMFHDGINGNIISSTGTVNIGTGGGSLFLGVDMVNDTTNFGGAVKIADKLLLEHTENDVALGIFNNLGTGDILTASAAGTTRFTVNNAGAIGLSSGFGSLGECLTSNGAGSAASWGACGGGFDPTDYGTTTWGDGSDFTWTFDISTGTNPTLAFSNGVIATNSTLRAPAFYDADNLSYFLDPAATGTSLSIAGDALLADDSWIGLGGSAGRIVFDDQSTDIISFLSSFVGVNTSGPDRRLDVLDASNPQLRLTHTDGSVYTDFQTDSDGDLIVSLSSGTPMLTLTTGTGNGHLIVGNGGAGSKITAADIDPLYTIDGERYSTWVPSMLGMKEEITGKATTQYNSQEGAYTYTLDFNSFDKNIELDMWVFSRIIDPNIDLISVLLTPNSQARTWYRKDPTTRKVTFFSDRPTEISYRLTAPRFDHERLSTISDETKISGLIVPPAPPTVGNGNPDGQDNFFTDLNITFHNGIYQLIDGFGNAVYRVEAFSNLMAANLSAGLINAQKITTDSLRVTADNVKIDGQDLRNYIIATIQNAVNNGQIALNGQEIISPLAEIDEIKTNIISPLATDTIEVDGNLDVNGDASISGDLLAENIEADSITTEELQTENATISGNLAANSITSNDASISGTLFANNIRANNIEGLDARIASFTAQFANNSATESANLYEYIAGVVSEYVNQEYINLTNISSDFATFREGLIALGPTTVTQMTATDSIAIGTSMIIGSNSINTLGSTLEIQPLKQGAISMMAGAVRIETDGTLNVTGNANFAGNVKIDGQLAAGIISPVGDNADLSVRLGNSDFSILDASSAARLSINNEGNIVASGSATFGKLNLAFAEQAYATSDTEAIATGSAGLATLKRYRTELTIKNPNVTENSLIYITPVGDTNNQVVSLRRQVSGESFTVGISTPAVGDIKFNWIIVN